MAHQRKLIRKAVADLLVVANTAAGARVLPTRVDPIEGADLPMLSVYTLSEEVDEASAETVPLELTRKLKLEITAWVAHSDALHVDDAMDDIAEQVEAAMDADYYIAGTVGDRMLEATDMQVVEGGSSDPLIGIVTLTYTLTYRTSPVEAESQAVSDFVTVDAKYAPVGGVSDTPVVEDTFTVQET